MDVTKPLPFPVGLRIEGECHISGESAERVDLGSGCKVEVRRASRTLMTGKDSFAMLVVAGHTIPVVLLLPAVEKIAREQAGQ